jgi:LacI family repressor for deo operon, udp, cdd, tsx, nupC, and nupG
MASIRDVAHKANVSVATVSRFLNDPEKVSKKAGQAVERAIEALNYKPNLLARNFYKSKSYSILVLVPNIANPFFSRLIRGIEDIGQQKGYAVLLGDTRFSQERESDYFGLVETRLADGIIQLAPEHPIAVYEGLSSVPLVNACECCLNTRFPSVNIDNAAAAKSVVDYLISIGHSRIACVLGPDESIAICPVTQHRLRGYQQAMESAGLSIDNALIFPGDFSLESGAKAAEHYIAMDNRPSAIFCMNDEMAIGLIQGLKTAGIRVPEDISVAGFDDIEMARFSDPPLTTVLQPAEHIGRTAMTVLADLLEGKTPEQLNHRLPTELIIRASTAPYKNSD